jgi:hypothetical protein
MALARLELATSDFVVLTTVGPDEAVFLLKPRRFVYEFLYSGLLIDVGHNLYLAKLRAHEIAVLQR